MADTGFQSCLARLIVVKQLGLYTKDLIPVDLRMHAADNHDIQLLGAAILRLSGKDRSGKEKSPRQVVYVTNQHPTQECICPKRTKPLPIPSTKPYPATEENRERLKQHLLDYYSSRTFNVCEHQPLPMMEGPPMRLMIDPNATPTA